MPELPGQEPLPPLMEEHLADLEERRRIRAEIYAIADVDRLRALCVDKELHLRGYRKAADKDRSDLAAAKQEARLATHHVGVLGDQLGKAEEELAAARAEIDRLKESLRLCSSYAGNREPRQGCRAVVEEVRRVLVAPDGAGREEQRS